MIDPTGHCEIGTDEHGNNIITKWDCTVGDFDKLSWDERKLWMELFMQETGHAWFYNILGILDYFANDNDFAGSAWASYSDAGVLQAINDGWRISGRGEAAIGTWVYTGGSGTVSYANAGSEWAIFFEMLARGNELSDLDAVRAQWGIAEQAGVDYGLLVANPFYNTDSSGERGKIDYFVYWGNTYRSMVENQAWNWDEAGHGFIMRKVINTFTDKPLDPRTTTSQNFVKNFSSLVISGTYEIVR